MEGVNKMLVKSGRERVNMGEYDKQGEEVISHNSQRAKKWAL